MKLQGTIETDFGFAAGWVHFGEEDGKDKVQLSFPLIGDMNNDTEEAVVTDSTVDCVMYINDFPAEIALKKENGIWRGTIDLKSIGFHKDLDATEISDEPGFAAHHFVIPEVNIKKLQAHCEYTYEDVETEFVYELCNEEVLAYVKEKGIDVENKHDFATACALMKKTAEVIHHDGVNYSHDNDNNGTIAQFQFAEKQGNYTNCRGIAIIFAGVLRAYGYKANVVECWPEKSDAPDIHVVCEAFIEELNKYVLLDVTNNLVLFLDGTPLSIIELRDAIVQEKSDLITINEDAAHNGVKADLIDSIAFMSRNLMFLRKGFVSDEETEVEKENAFCLAPKDLIEEGYPKSARFTCNRKEFYA